MGSRDDEKIEILIDYNNWQEMDELQRTTTIYHELSHDILNARHVDEEDELMHPTYLFKSIPELVVAMTSIFQDYKNGSLPQFEEEEIELSIPFDNSIQPLTVISN